MNSNPVNDHLNDIFLNTKARELMERAETIAKPCFIGIDGRCASGKTTLSEILHQTYGCPVVHLDDFFLRPEQRTKERYAEPGGNLDRERLLEEVILPLEQRQAVTYQRFDCSIMKLNEQLHIPLSDVIVFEGSYCLHPSLRDHFHWKVFMDVDPDEQLRRIEERSGKEKRKDFETRWIPLEEHYFSFYHIQEVADLVIRTSD